MRLLIYYVLRRRLFTGVYGERSLLHLQRSSLSRMHLGYHWITWSVQLLRKSRPFQLKLVDFVNPMETDYDMLDQYIDILGLAREDDRSELIDCTNILPQQLYMKYKYISQFYLFKWLYQCGTPGKPKRFEEIEVTDRFLGIQLAGVEEARHIHNSYYILRSVDISLSGK